MGLYEKAEFSLDLNATNFYETFKNSKVSAGLRLGLDAEADAGIFKDDNAKWGISLLEQDFEILSSYLLPTFDQENIKVDDETKKATASYNVSNDLMFNSGIGISLFEENKKIKNSSPKYYVFEKECDNPLLATFDGLSEDTKYIVNPYVKWGDWIIEATPQLSFTIAKDEEEEEDPDKNPSDNIRVTTGVATGLQKDATILSGSMIGLSAEDITSYGFIYTSNGTPSADNGVIVSNNEIIDENFSSTISDLEEEVVYYWCAYVKTGETYYYGDIKNFTINKSVSEEARNILIALYDATGGNNWFNKENWKSDQPINTWYGVTIQNGLIYLDLSNNNLTKYFAGMKDCADFAEVNLSGNNITSFHFSNLSSLTKINFNNCQLLNEFTSLSNNELCNLNINGCTSLTHVQIWESKLKTLDFSQCTNMQYIDVNKNQLENLNLTNCKDLNYLTVHWNSLSELNLDDCINLETLFCGWNHISELNLTNCTKLVDVSCWENQMSVLSLNAPNTLVRLECNNNSLSSLSIKGYTALTSINLRENHLESIDFTNCPVLEYATINYNQLTSLDITGCSKLHTIYCEGNKINSEIPIEFDKLRSFHHNSKYSYTYNSDGSFTYKTNDFGWWYPGEPNSGKHERN